jgi:hypothetical protein
VILVGALDQKELSLIHKFKLKENKFLIDVWLLKQRWWEWVQHQGLIKVECLLFQQKKVQCPMDLQTMGPRMVILPNVD